MKVFVVRLTTNAIIQGQILIPQMKLMTDGVWSISKMHLKILKAVEKHMENHKVISLDVLRSKSRIKGSPIEYIVDLCKLKYLSHWGQDYKLTYSGYDCLAINALRSNGLEAMGERIGVGKEADIYLGVYKGKEVVLKFHRLGRTSFKTVKKNRGYINNKVNWLTLCKISCRREVMYLEKFKDMEVPTVLDYNRHIIVQELLDYQPLYKTEITNVKVIFELMLRFIKDLWIKGYVHGDFNEFNVMVNKDIKVIDFPQCIENTNTMALHYLKRDLNCVTTYFKRKYNYEPENNCHIKFFADLEIDGTPMDKELIYENLKNIAEPKDHYLVDQDSQDKHKLTSTLESEMGNIFISKNLS